MNRKALSARCAPSSRSTRSRRRIRWRLRRYSFSPERYSRRPSSTWPKSTGRRASALSRTRVTSAIPSAERFSEPAKMTSSLFARPKGAALLAERPAKGVGEVALARSVRADDGADARPELDGRPLGERLEAVEPQAQESGRRRHPVAPWRCSARSQGIEGLGGRGRLGDPPRRSLTDPDDDSVDGDLDPELLLVIRADGLDDAVLRSRARPPLGQLLETTLGALEGARRGRRGLERVGRELEDPVARRAVAEVEVERPDEGLEAGRQQRWPETTAALGFAFAESEVLAEVDPSREAGETGRADDRRPTGRQRALVVVRMAGEEGLRDGQVHDDVTEELEAFVVAAGGVGMLMQPARMDERLVEQVQVLDRQAEVRGDGRTRAHRRRDRTARRSGARRCSRQRPGRSGSSRRPRPRSRSRTPPRGS